MGAPAGRRSFLLACAGGAACAACGPPAAPPRVAEDEALLREILRRQEERVARARAEVERIERELRVVRMRRRMLERAGRHDLAVAFELEEESLRLQLATATRAASDEEDALAIYRRSGAAGG